MKPAYLIPLNIHLMQSFHLIGLPRDICQNRVYPIISLRALEVGMTLWQSKRPNFAKAKKFSPTICIIWGVVEETV
jgi:hypothetical protein